MGTKKLRFVSFGLILKILSNPHQQNYLAKSVIFDLFCFGSCSGDTRLGRVYALLRTNFSSEIGASGWSKGNDQI